MAISFGPGCSSNEPPSVVPRMAPADMPSPVVGVSGSATTVTAPDQTEVRAVQKVTPAEQAELQPDVSTAAAASPVAMEPMGTPVPVVGEQEAQFVPKNGASTVGPSDASRKVEAVLDRIVAGIFQVDRVTWFGLAIVAALILFYTFDNRSPFFTLAFATTFWVGSAYGYRHGSWPAVIVGAIWGCLALRKCWWDISSKCDGAWKTAHLVLVWHVRFIAGLAVLSAIVLLLVDSPISARLGIPVNRGIAEAVPLVLVGIAFLAWLAIERPPIIEFMKQLLLAIAFILWGIDALLPASPWSRFVGAVVIAIYVFDLAWLMEGNLRKLTGAGCTSPICKFAGVCCCNAASESPPAGSTDKQKVRDVRPGFVSSPRY